MPARSTRVLVVGGGPAGSTAATLLAREGFEVTLLEKAAFPRYHIGESLLPSILQILDLTGVREKVESHRFQRKPGAYFEWGDERWSLDFGELGGHHSYAFQVARPEFDQLLLQHAATQGVRVCEGVELRHLEFDGERPRRAAWESADGRHAGTVTFEFLIDASGRTGIMTTRYLRNRRFHDVFKNVAIWGYWRQAGRPATAREGDIVVVSVRDGWFWAIPLRDGSTSIGVVMHKDAIAQKRPASTEAIYRHAIAECPTIAAVVASADLVSPVRAEQDYSYTADCFGGPGFLMVGDAACFLDPLLSSGVHLATFSALRAAASLASLFRGETAEDEAVAFYERSYRHAYLRYLVFISAFYDQYRGQREYFWEAQRLSRSEGDSTNLKQAFLKLVTGVEDLSDIQDNVHEVVLRRVSERLAENLRLRQVKPHLTSMPMADRSSATSNARFFDAIEGLFTLSAEGAVEGLYVATTPRLRLARVSEHEAQRTEVAKPQ